MQINSLSNSIKQNVGERAALRPTGAPRPRRVPRATGDDMHAHTNIPESRTACAVLNKNRPLNKKLRRTLRPEGGARLKPDAAGRRRLANTFCLAARPPLNLLVPTGRNGLPELFTSYRTKKRGSPELIYSISK